MADYVDKGLKEIGITISKPMLAVVCIIAGVMVILFPFLAWIVGLLLATQGTLLLAGIPFGQERRMAKYCYSCGAGNTEEAAYCKRCGKKLVQPDLTITAQPQAIDTTIEE